MTEYTKAKKGMSFIMDEDEIIFLDDTRAEVFATYPLNVIDIAVAWLEVAEEKNWEYKDFLGLPVGRTQLDRYIERLQEIKESRND